MVSGLYDVVSGHIPDKDAWLYGVRLLQKDVVLDELLRQSCPGIAEYFLTPK